MKSKTIKAVLRKKTDEWLASIEDDAVRMIGQKRPPMLFGVVELKPPHGVSVMAAAEDS